MSKFNQLSLEVLVFILKILSVLLLIFVFAKLVGPIPFSVSSVNTNRSEGFSVTGEGTVDVAPDLAVVRVGVEATGVTVQEAQSQMNAVSNAISEAVKSLGVDPKDIKTENYNIYPIYDPVPPTSLRTRSSAGVTLVEAEDVAIEPSVSLVQTLPEPASPPAIPRPPVDDRISSYRASTNLVVKVRDINKANQVIDASTAAGGNQVGGIQFTVDDEAKALDEARAKAVEDARKKAEVASRTAGFKLGKLINYYENGGGGDMFYAEKALDSRSAMGASVPTQVEPGTNTIRMSVTLVYEIE